MWSVYEFLYKAIYYGSIEKEIFNCLDREDQTFHWISINNIDNEYAVVIKKGMPSIIKVINEIKVEE